MDLLKVSALASAIVVVPSVSVHAAVVGTNPSHLLAYTDPGSGAMLWQILLSSGVVLSFYFGRAKRWIMERFASQKTETAAERKSA